jgi:hypothetical protein
MIAYFERFEIKMTLEQAKSVSHQGQCIEDVLELLKDKKYLSQFYKIDSESIAAKLKEYGAWDEEELKDVIANQERITWLAGHQIVEDYKENIEMKLTRRYLNQLNRHAKELESLGAIDGIEAYNTLCRIEKRAHKLAEDLCNIEIPEEIQDKRAAAIYKQIEKVFGRVPEGVFINYDPRGYALKIRSENNKKWNDIPSDNEKYISYTDWGDYGILAPEFDK